MKGFLIGILIGASVVVAFMTNRSVLSDSFRPFGEMVPAPVVKFFEQNLGGGGQAGPSTGNRDLDSYNFYLANFQKYSSGKPSTFSEWASGENREDRYQTMRFLYLPSFEPHWLFEAVRYRDDNSDDVILTVQKFDHNPEGENIKAITKGEKWIVTDRSIRKFTSFAVSPEEFDAAMQDVIRLGGWKVESQPSDLNNICIDGISYKFEMSDVSTDDSDWVLFDDGRCDEKEFQSRLAIVTPLLRMADRHLPMFQDQMTDRDSELLGFSSLDAKVD